MEEVTKTEGSTTINMHPNNNGWNGYGNGGLGDIMRGFGGNINIGRGTGAAGIALGTVGTALAGLIALREVFGGRGFGGNGGPHEDFVTQRELGLVKENNALLAENGQLKSQVYTDNKADEIIKTLVEWRQRQELIDTQVAADVAALKNENATLKAMLNGMLGTYIAPQAFGPSQAIYSQMTARNATPAASGSGS